MAWSHRIMSQTVEYVSNSYSVKKTSLENKCIIFYGFDLKINLGSKPFGHAKPWNGAPIFEGSRELQIPCFPMFPSWYRRPKPPNGKGKDCVMIKR